MAKMTLDQLRKLREETKGEMTRRETEGKEIQVIVGMGTCGIAAGAKESFDAIVKAVDEFKIGANVVIRQTGCMGLCHVEPTVEVIVPGMPATIYGRVDAAVAADIVRKHLVDHKMVNGHIYDRPAIDIISK
ncbi:MAG: NAD(P)-dependent iron-only hydrogenase iron-sulfur protein [Spirochaetes bacterium GWD1_61_31]|nr:MAG: NAD(P)-dependent iron-only hydrogenase iron-sulfur protein [Spirochaetes bacterium GWB1_60_80]OHD35336.1 MAG: NAD(P)-dependent iron-only hydrogenase iron-sulfur protein [Spirochaetes bacterium GWC1_61_12]OHD43666.1 MAG: NAD(P)-dependent iron-only hydrogenase iron-sulfur protein [Spirochaetes bacterium GWD1_61_31]OHD44992.1 MAG: NAD(P)-dependent iron-only hydrogenase iron-sulfur protein [Spirochaetes bacterium GWE1_60_18]OHD60101.1 MAG: NAD(P)-dependent iron-only hydrogenase iron-sulfur 